MAVDPGFVDDPVVQELLGSATPMRLAYVGANGQPHVVPIGTPTRTASSCA